MVGGLGVCVLGCVFKREKTNATQYMSLHLSCASGSGTLSMSPYIQNYSEVCAEWKLRIYLL